MLSAAQCAHAELCKVYSVALCRQLHMILSCVQKDNQDLCVLFK